MRKIGEFSKFSCRFLNPNDFFHWISKNFLDHWNNFFLTVGQDKFRNKITNIVRNDMHCVSFCWFYCSLASKKPVRLFMGQQKFTHGYFKFPIKLRYGIIVVKVNPLKFRFMELLRHTSKLK